MPGEHDAFTCPRRYESDPLLSDSRPDCWRDGVCTYCGSISPERFFKLIEDGAEVGPTDKDYKAYVHGEDFSGAVHGKFYFRHLDDAGRYRFLDLLQAGSLNIGYPGSFYVLPFFLRLVP